MQLETGCGDVPLVQWFPTGVPRPPRVPRDSVRGASVITFIDLQAYFSFFLAILALGVPTNIDIADQRWLEAKTVEKP